MADQPVSRQKRQGNYTPERILSIQAEVAQRYAANESARALAKEYAISKMGVRGCVERSGGQWRDRQTAGVLCRSVSEVSEAEANDQRSVAQQVADKLGYGTSAGLSYDKDFRSACARENRRRSAESRRALERRRKEYLNRIPTWANRQAIQDFYDLATMFGMTVDHEVPLQGKNICGLHVETNLRLLSFEDNASKGNKFVVGPDPVIDRLARYHEGSTRGSAT